VHSVDAIVAMSSSELDAFQFGPVFETASKREFGTPKGLDDLSLAAKAARGTAVIAVGGVSARQVEPCRRAGAAGTSVIGAIWDAEHVESAARQIVAADRLLAVGMG
jgi:thiamine-phosphate pyrophosphorylase